MTQYIYILMLFTKVSVGSGSDLQLIEAELRLDPVTCMMKAQVINSGATEEDARLAACMPVLWSDDAEIDPDILEKRR
jgi:hypothetical protein